MTLELNKPYLVKRVASNGGVLHYLPMDGFCDDIALDAPVLAKRVASNAGVLHYLIGNQQLAADGKLTLNKPYLAKRVANKAGTLHYLIGGKPCCLCDDVTANGTVTVASAAYTGSFPLDYYADLRTALLSRPPDITSSVEPVPGWAGYLDLDPVYNPMNRCSTPYYPNWFLAVWIRRCDMKVWVHNAYTVAVIDPENQGEFYGQCDDVDDIVVCDPLELVRKMNLAAPVSGGGGSGRPLRSCSSTRGEDCTGEEYVTFTIP